MLIKPVSLVVALSCGVQAHAQMSAPPIVSALPNVASISADNAAGVLQYCVKKNLVSSVSAGSVIDGLTKKPDITKSPDFSAGQAGQILADKKFSIGAAPGYLQSQACDMVLDQAKRL
ncbi:MAG: DUF2501 domain-containing protein [Sphingomicrobium sp.]